MSPTRTRHASEGEHISALCRELKPEAPAKSRRSKGRRSITPSLALQASIVRRFPRHCGLTLFEVLLALALFLGTMAVLSQLWYGGVRASVQSQLRTQAVLRCESKLNEVVAGVLPLQPVTDTPFEDDASWSWNIQVLPGPHADVLLVIVNVVHPGQGGLSSSGHQLSRLIRDPQVWTDAQQTTEEMP